MAGKTRPPDRFALAGDAEITDPVTGRILMLGDVIRESLPGGVHTLANRQVIAADIIADKMRGRVKPHRKGCSSLGPLDQGDWTASVANARRVAPHR